MDFMWYILIALAILVIAYLIHSFKKINSISKDATLLVAFTKAAISEIRFSNSKEIPADKQYNYLMQACYLFNCFVQKTNGLKNNYKFNIIENGPTFGTVIEVQLASFIQTIKRTLQKKTDSLPIEYREKIELYMKNPFSEEGLTLSEEAASLFSSDSNEPAWLKKLNNDFLYKQ